jgi:homogentisate 1,2-dioxygenase
VDPSLPRWTKGSTSRQAHVSLPPGTVEEEHGRDGFYGPASHLYRRHAPTAWTSVDGPAAHRAYST